MGLHDINHKPEFKVMTEAMESEIEKVLKHYAQRFLDYYRELLKDRNTSRHKITLSCGMGVCNIMIDKRGLYDYPDVHGQGIFKLLIQIEHSIDWNWGAYLNGQSLN